MIKRLKINESSRTASRYSKYWIIVDEHISNILEPLKKKGYNVSSFPKETSDLDICKEINKKRKSDSNKGVDKPFILITQDWDDFEQISNRKFHLFELKYKVIPDAESLANKIENILIYSQKDFKDGEVTPIRPADKSF